jgi:hypothetical protein
VLRDVLATLTNKNSAHYQEQTTGKSKEMERKENDTPHVAQVCGYPCTAS